MTHNVDPITGVQSCVVTADDYTDLGAFTQVGRFYPVVEMNAQLGLLVGVSSGGRYRIPTGDILWRVDDAPYRELKPIDNPQAKTAAQAEVDPTAKSMQNAIAIASSFSATSTMASGDRAKAMLAEMLAGKGLIFRQAAAATPYGLPSAATTAVGQMTLKGLRPIPLDESFRAGLRACGIEAPTPA